MAESNCPLRETHIGKIAALEVENREQDKKLDALSAMMIEVRDTSRSNHAILQNGLSDRIAAKLREERKTHVALIGSILIAAQAAIQIFL